MSSIETANGAKNGVTHVRGKGRPGLHGAAPIRRPVPIASIVVPPDGWNARTHGISKEQQREEDERVRALADSIAIEGLYNALVVVKLPDGPDGEERFGLLQGRRRYRAITEILKLHSTVDVSVMPVGSEPWGPALANLAENTQREGLHTADVARRLQELVDGTYPIVEGIGGVPAEVPAGSVTSSPKVPIKTVAKEAGFSESYVRSLAAAWRNACSVLRASWRQLDVPTDLATAWARLGEVEQIQRLEAWSKEQAAEAKRRTRKGEKERASKDEDEEGATAKARSRSEVAALVAKFRERLETVKLPAREAEVATARIEALEMVLGPERMVERLRARIEGEKLPAREVDTIHAQIEALEWAMGQRKRLTFT